MLCLPPLNVLAAIRSQILTSIMWLRNNSYTSLSLSRWLTRLLPLADCHLLVLHFSLPPVSSFFKLLPFSSSLFDKLNRSLSLSHTFEFPFDYPDPSTLFPFPCKPSKQRFLCRPLSTAFFPSWSKMHILLLAKTCLFDELVKKINK